MKVSTFLTFVTGAAVVSAQSLSTGCSETLKGIISSPDAACLNPSALLSFFVGNAQSVPDTVNNWLGGLCAVGTCSNASLASVAATVTSGCASDLSAFNVSVGAGLQQTITQIVQQVYPTARSIMCLKDNASSKFCATEMLSSIETLTGKLSASSLNLQTILSDFQNLVASAANLACTNCTKAAFSLAAPLTAQFPQASSAIDTLCGAGFAESASSLADDGVSQTAVNEQFALAPIKSSGASSLQPVATIVLALLSMWALL